MSRINSQKFIHDVRTPLMTISMSTELMKTFVSKNCVEGQNQLDILLSAVNEVTRLVAELDGDIIHTDEQ